MVLSEVCFRHLMPISEALKIFNVREAVTDLPLVLSQLDTDQRVFDR